MADVLLVRHGQASFGAADYDRLSALGEEQSRRLGRWLAHAGAAPDLVVTGGMRRHARTAELCLEAANVRAPALVLHGLDEMDHEDVLARHRPDLAAPGALSAELARAGDPHRAFQKIYADATRRWTSGVHDAEYACSWTAFRENVLACLREPALREPRTIWAFTSGGPIAVIANALLGAPPAEAFALAWPLVNTSITRIALGAGGSRLVTYNAWPHLEGEGVAGLVTHR